MNGAVVDASVILKWVLDDEEYVENAVALRDAYIEAPDAVGLFVPGLWLYEVVNGIAVAVVRGRLPAEEAVECLRDLLALDLSTVDVDPEQVLSLCLEHGLASYDAAYLAVADLLNVPMWTGDRRFYDKVKGRHSNIRWIGDYPGQKPCTNDR